MEELEYVNRTILSTGNGLDVISAEEFLIQIKDLLNQDKSEYLIKNNIKRYVVLEVCC